MQKVCMSSLRRAAESEHFYRVVSASIYRETQNLRQEKTHPHTFIKHSSLGSILRHFFGQCKPGVKLDDHSNYKANKDFLMKKWEDEARPFSFKTKTSLLRFPFIKGLVFKRFNSQKQYMSSVTYFNTTSLELCKQHRFFKSSNWPLLQSQLQSFNTLKS